MAEASGLVRFWIATLGALKFIDLNEFLNVRVEDFMRSRLELDVVTFMTAKAAREISHLCLPVDRGCPSQ